MMNNYNNFVMHYISSIAGLSFAESYGDLNKVVVDIGGFDYNGSLRSSFTERGMKYICIDMTEDPSVDIVIKPGEKLPFETGTIDLVVSSSCFEHDPCFWLTFKELTRIVKNDGFIYINAPSNGIYHRHPGDNWRFYSDAGQALAYWSGIQMGNEEVFPVKVIETFHILPHETISIPLTEYWIDFVCVWKRVNDKETDIVVSQEIINNVGVLEKSINDKQLKTVKKYVFKP